jgi:hypothetical protein
LKTRVVHVPKLDVAGSNPVSRSKNHESPAGSSGQIERGEVKLLTREEFWADDE